jgi:hypothetical protein
MMLVLDNCEHVTAAPSSLVEEVLTMAPAVRIWPAAAGCRRFPPSGHCRPWGGEGPRRPSGGEPRVAVVLDADPWKSSDLGLAGRVVHGKTFVLDDFDFTHAGRRVHGGGDSGVCSTGFSFVTDQAGSRIAGPLTSILALRHGVEP